MNKPYIKPQIETVFLNLARAFNVATSDVTRQEYPDDYDDDYDEDEEGYWGD